MNAKVYSGRRENGTATVWVDNENVCRLLPLCLELRNHSPTGFEWGYGGSGPAQLALAILADHFGDVRATDQYDARAPSYRSPDFAFKALQFYQDFKWKVIANLNRASDWTLSTSEVAAAIDAIRAERAASTQ